MSVDVQELCIYRAAIPRLLKEGVHPSMVEKAFRLLNREYLTVDVATGEVHRLDREITFVVTAWPEAWKQNVWPGLPSASPVTSAIATNGVS